MVEIKTTDEAVSFCQKLVQKVSEEIGTELPDDKEAARHIIDKIGRLFDNVTWILHSASKVITDGNTIVFNDDGTLHSIKQKKQLSNVQRFRRGCSQQNQPKDTAWFTDGPKRYWPSYSGGQRV